MKANVEKWLRRDKKRFKRKHGMRVSGAFTKQLPELLNKKSGGTS